MIRVLYIIWMALVIFGGLILISGVGHAAPRQDIKRIVIEEARAQQSVPLSLAMAVAKVESDFNARAESSKGARGVMQIMPKTARSVFQVHPDDLWDARTNVRLGLRFLDQLSRQYDGRWDLALSHYNGGTIKNGQVHGYTRKYVALVQKWQAIYEEQFDLWGQAVARIDAPSADDQWQEEDRPKLALVEWREVDEVEEPDWEGERYRDEVRFDQPRWRERPRRFGYGHRPPPPPRHHGRGRGHGGFH